MNRRVLPRATRCGATAFHAPRRAPAGARLARRALLAALALASPVGAHEFPEAVVGLYAVPATACSLVAAHGFTVVHNYDFENRTPADAMTFVRHARAYLDAAGGHGLRVLLGVPRAWMRQQREAPLRTVIRSLRTHPALLAWYEDERSQSGDHDGVVLLQRLVGDLDPDHGLVIEEGRNDSRLRRIGRVRMFTWYPVTRKARDRGHLMRLSDRFDVRKLDVPFWPVLQAYGHDRVAGYPRPRFQSPTRRELQYCLYAALIAGADGVFFYPFLHPTSYDAAREAQGTWPYGRYRPLPEVAPETWRAVIEAAADARRLLPLLRAAPRQAWGAPLPRVVEAAWWRTSRGTLAVLAHRGTAPRAIDVPVPPGTRAWRRLRRGRFSAPRALEGTTLRLELPGPGGIVVLFEGAPPGAP